MTQFFRLSEPAAEPVTLDQAKAHLRVETTDDDVLLLALISAARSHAEGFCQRPFAQSEWAVVLDAMPAGLDPVQLPVGTVSVDSFTYYDPNGDAQSIGLSTVTLDTVRSLLYPSEAWPAGDRVQVNVTAGPDTASSPPELPDPGVIAGIKLILGDLYENREAAYVGMVQQENPTAVALLYRHRVRIGI